MLLQLDLLVPSAWGILPAEHVERTVVSTVVSSLSSTRLSSYQSSSPGSAALSFSRSAMTFYCAHVRGIVSNMQTFDIMSSTDISELYSSR